MLLGWSFVFLPIILCPTPMRQVKQPGKKTTCPQRSDATTTAKGPSRKWLSRNSCKVGLVPETLEYPLRTEAGIFRHTLLHLISFKINKNPRRKMKPTG